MNVRATILCSCLLSTACGPGPDDTTDTAATSGGASTSASGSSTGGATTGGSGTSSDTTPTTGGTTVDAVTTTGDATSATSGTTGTPTCADIVGSQDCEALVAVATELSLETCIQCQGVPCGQEPACDQEFPCVDAAIVIQGCCSDDQCAGLSPFCGMFIATNNVCVNNDDV